MPIEGLPSSNQQAAAAGTGGILSTGFDRKARVDPNATPPDNEPKNVFKNVLIEMISSDSISEVNVKRERKPHEEELLYQQELKRISENRLNSVVKKKDERRQPKKKTPREEEAEGENIAPEPGILSPAAEYLSFSDRVRKIEEVLLKDYISLTAKMIVQRPKDELDSVRIRLTAVREALAKAGITQMDFKYLDQKTIDMIKESFLKMIKDRFFGSVNSPLDMSGWILNAKSPKSIIDILNALEKESLSLSEKALILNDLDISDLAQLAAHLNLDLDSIMNMFTHENVKIAGAFGENISFHLFELPQIKDASKIINDFRSSQTDLYLEDNPFKKFRAAVDIRRLENNLKGLGVDKANIDNIRTQSRRIAWLKVISELKEAHLNRILSSSSGEFDKASKAISKLTGKSNVLGYDIPKEGIKWIETGLETLAVETAQYKLELLKSLQKINFEESRKRDIQHLTSVIASLRRRTGR